MPAGHGHTPYFQKNPIGLPYRLFLYVHSFSRIFHCSFGWGCEPAILGKSRAGVEMVYLSKECVSSYSQSIVTFPVSLCVSEILPLLFSSEPLFPTPPLVYSLPKITPYSPRSRCTACSTFIATFHKISLCFNFCAISDFYLLMHRVQYGGDPENCFYRAMHFSVKCGLAIACRPSVTLVDL